jgi:hypothetical protein
VEHFAVAYALGKEPLSCGKCHTVGLAEHPAAVFFAIVGEALARVTQQLREEFR